MNSPFRKLFCLSLALLGAVSAATAQDLSSYPSLAASRMREGDDTLRAFADVSAMTRQSVVEVNVNEDAVALGAIVESDGLILTKASELKPGKLTCWLANGRELPARRLATDDDADVALLRVPTNGLKAIRWATETAELGQWAITPNLSSVPQAAGIVSASSRKIRPQRAYMGVVFSRGTPLPEIGEVDAAMGAAKAGLVPGDIIAEIDGTTVTNKDQVYDMLGDFREGQSVKVNIYRGQKHFETNITLITPREGRFAQELIFEEHENRMSGDISSRALGFDSVIEHDTVLEPWMCGGPLVDLDGRAIGLNIARASRVATYALPASLAEHVLRDLKAKAHLPGSH